MAYIHDTWIFSGSIEHEYKYKGKYGAKGEKRQQRKRATPEQISRQNQRNREKNMRRLIKANFREEDLWVTLKYPKGTRKPLDEVKGDVRSFLSRLRYAYRKRGEDLRFIYRMEIGTRGGIHIHLLVNRIRGEPSTDVLVQRKWEQGRAHFESVYDRGGYHDLACYIVKLPDEKVERQMSLFHEEERRELIRYSCSRNLIRPQPARKEYAHWTMRRLLQDGPDPTPGYYIDKDSVICGVNQYTGMSYLQYTEYLLKQRGRGQPDDG